MVAGADLETEPDAIEQLEAFRAELGPTAGYSVVIFKRKADGTGFARCRKFAIDQIDLDDLPKMFGAGDYCLGVNDPKNVRVHTYRVTFDAAAAPPSDETAAPPSGLAAAIEKLQTAIEADRDRSNRMMESMIAALAGRDAPGANLKDQLEIFQMLAGLTKQTNTPASGEIAEAFKAGAEAIRTLGNPDGDEKGGDVIGKLMEGLLARLPTGTPATATNAPATATNAPATATQGNGQPQGSDAAPVALPAGLQQFEVLRPYAGQVISWARVDFDPGRAAGIIYHAVTDDSVLRSLVAMAPPQLRELMTILDPRLVPYLRYVELIATELRDLVEGDGDDGSLDTGATVPPSEPA